MRYFSFAYPDEDDNDIVETWSEEDVRQKYWPYWYKKMCEKFEQAYVDEHYSFEDCLYDWQVVNWAWEVTDENKT